MVHEHRWRSVGHLDFCHFFKNVYACECGAVREQSGERPVDSLVLWMPEDGTCLRCNELLRGAEPKYTDVITEKEEQPQMWSPSGRYKKRPVEVQAYQFLAVSNESVKKIIEWSDGKVQGMFDDNGGPHLRVETLEGVMRVDDGDWVIRGVKGEFYPCKPDIFEETYDVVEDE